MIFHVVIQLFKYKPCPDFTKSDMVNKKHPVREDIFLSIKKRIARPERDSFKLQSGCQSTSQ